MKRYKDWFYNARFFVRQQGASLLEYLSVISLVGFISAISLPSLIEWQNKKKYQANIAQIHQVFIRAQRKAQHEQRDYWVGIEAQCVWLHQAANGNCQQHGQYRMTDFLQLQPKLAQGNRIRFTSKRGFSGFGAGQIIAQSLTYPEHEVRYVISALGRVRLCQIQPFLVGIGVCA